MNYINNIKTAGRADSFNIVFSSLEPKVQVS